MFDRFMKVLKDSEMLQSKKFRAFAVGLIIWGLNEAGIANMDPVMLDKALILIGTYMGFQTLADFSPRYSKPRGG